MKLIEGTGATENGGVKAVCAACCKDFDERGGVLFDSGQVSLPFIGQAGLCADCANEVLRLVGKEPA